MYKFFAYLNRMKYIYRWGLMHSNVPENVMEHSQHVAVVAHALATVSNVYFGGNVNADRVAVLALFHETGEVLTGDLPTPIKYYNREIHASYKNLEKIACNKLLSYLPEKMQPVYADAVLSDGEERKFVHYADKICAYVKCLEEVRMGNSEFVAAERTLKSTIKAFNSREADFFMKNFVEAYKLSLDDLQND